MRLLQHIGETGLIKNGRSFKLQVAAKSGTCDTAFVGETYADVTTSSTGVKYYNNTTPADAATISTTADDPAHSGHTKVVQTYEEANNFTNPTATPSGQDAMWDFALTDNSAFGAYCLRVVSFDDSQVGFTYTQIPEVLLCDAPDDTSRLMRHGSYFCDGGERRFFWSR